MSVFKVIGNTYTDLLDYINVEYRKNNFSIDRLFQQMKSSEKRQLIDKVAYLYQRIDTLRMAQEKFWNSKKTMAAFFKFLLIVIIIVGAVIMGYFFWVQLTRGGIYLMTEKLRLFLIYAIMYMIFFSIFFLLLRNLGYNNDQSLATRKEVMDKLGDFKKLLNLQGDIQTLLLFVSYRSTDSVSKYQFLWKNNANLLRKYIINAPMNTAELRSENGVNYEVLFNDKQTVLKAAIDALFANGNGYTTVKKELVSSSNALMIKEFRSVMRFYYLLVKRIENAGSLEDMEANRLKTIDTYVIRDISNIPQLMRASETTNENAYISSNKAPLNTDLTRLVAANISNPSFDVEWKELKIVLAYTLVYCYQLWIRKTTADKDLPAALKAVNIMPHMIDLKNLPGSNPDLYKKLQDVFSRNFTNRMQNLVQTEKARTDAVPTPEAPPASGTPPNKGVTSSGKQDNASDDTCVLVPDKSIVPGESTSVVSIPAQSSDAKFNTALNTVLNDVKDEIEKHYNMTMIKLDGDYWFPYDANFLLQNTPQIMKEVYGVDPVKDQKYYREFMFEMSKSVIPNSMKNFKMYQKNQGNLSQRITPIISKMNIKLKDYSAYIITKMEDMHGTLKPEVKARVVELINQIDTDVKTKLASVETTYGKKMNDLRFLDLDTFVGKIDDIPYADLKIGLNYVYFKSILDQFYFAVSNSVNAKSSNTKDIYFHDTKRINLSKQAFILLVVIFSTFIVYHIIGIFDEYKFAGKAINKYFADKTNINNMPPEQRKEINNMRFAFMDKKVSLWFKALIPIAGMIFILSLVWSFVRKSEAKHNFNRETIDGNTSSLRASVHELNLLFSELDSRIRTGETTALIKNLPQITMDDKTKMYENMKNIVNRFEKCNYILAAQQGDIPFPYTEATIDMFMILICILCLIYVYGKIDPIERVRDLKALYALKEKGQYLENDQDFTNEVTTKAKCHDSDIDSIVFTMKVLFFLFVIMFLIFYSTKVLQSTSEYEFGIYNSIYFEESLCLD